MKLFNLVAISLGLFAVHSTSLATTTLTFSNGTIGRMSGFGNAAGTPTNGLHYGLLIDTAGNGFAHYSSTLDYNYFSRTASGFVSATNTTSGVSSITDDYFYVPSALPSTNDGSAVGSETGTQVSTITSVAGAPNGTDGLIPGVSTGDAFAIIWFAATPAEGSAFGIFTIPQFVLPASGTSVSFASNFTGNDAAKAANLSFYTPVLIPEPSRVLLMGFSLVGLALRRRRK
jgi:hypothetical protein